MKSWYLSKTLWFNIITLIIGIIGQATEIFPMDAQTAKVFALIIAAGNFILRFMTSEPIVMKKDA